MNIALRVCDHDAFLPEYVVNHSANITPHARTVHNALHVDPKMDFKVERVVAEFSKQHDRFRRKQNFLMSYNNLAKMFENGTHR